MKRRRKERVVMCQKLKEINGLRPQFILDTYYQSSSIPINMKAILKSMKISCFPSNFSELETNLHIKHRSILGMAASKGDNLIIIYSNHLDNVTANYVLAHELGHCCLHLPVTSEFHVELKTENDIYSYPTWLRLKFDVYSGRDSDPKEQEADAFAAHLLLPDQNFQHYISQKPRPNRQQLSKIFCVPSRLIDIKVQNSHIRANEGGKF